MGELELVEVLPPGDPAVPANRTKTHGKPGKPPSTPDPVRPDPVPDSAVERVGPAVWAGLEAWLSVQPADRSYDYHDRCLVTLYLEALGITGVVGINQVVIEARTYRLPDDWNWINRSRPWTTGAALERLRRASDPSVLLALGDRGGSGAVESRPPLRVATFNEGGV